jgi:saccharopepsin
VPLDLLTWAASRVVVPDDKMLRATFLHVAPRFFEPLKQGPFVMLVGTWENEYGSRMTLAAERGAISGFYESTTGSIGRYRITGWHSATEPTGEAGQPVALAITWHSIADGPSDASWNWTSSLGGQLSILAGEEVLVVTHLLVATTPFPSLCEPGVYNDKLTYRRVSDAAAVGDRGPIPADLSDPQTSCWAAEDGTKIRLEVNPERHRRFGLVSGSLWSGSAELEITGFTDCSERSNREGLQSLAIAAVDRSQNIAMTFGGWIDHETGILSVQSLRNQATSRSDTYLQTAIRPMAFVRCDAP